MTHGSAPRTAAITAQQRNIDCQTSPLDKNSGQRHALPIGSSIRQRPRRNISRQQGAMGKREGIFGSEAGGVMNFIVFVMDRSRFAARSRAPCMRTTLCRG
jgi:hypothetical protein